MTHTDNVCLIATNIWKAFRLYHHRVTRIKEVLMMSRSRYELFWALKGISFELHGGQTLGIIGRNGSGKTTLLALLARILVPTRGQVFLRGKVCSLLELGAGFHPELTGRENVFLNGSVLGLSRKEIASKFEAIHEFSELADFIDVPVKNYSSGMQMRLGFSVAAFADPDILLVDEGLAVGDEAFQRKCKAKIAEFRNGGKTIVVVSHVMSQVREICDEAIWLDAGKMMAKGKVEDVIGRYQESIASPIP